MSQKGQELSVRLKARARKELAVLLTMVPEEGIDVVIDAWVLGYLSAIKDQEKGFRQNMHWTDVAGNA